ncbi:MAG: hypothetical protein JWO51_191 [Rhodospirillales bacterium]|nr:hypothetical protein [Rhodospirillales bacterium]
MRYRIPNGVPSRDCLVEHVAKSVQIVFYSRYVAEAWRRLDPRALVGFPNWRLTKQLSHCRVMCIGEFLKDSMA